MGKQIVRVGDVNSAGGKVVTGDNSVRINGIPVAVDGSLVSCHAPFSPPHVHARCRASVNNIKVNGKRLILVGDTDTCGHKRVQGSSNTNGQ